MRCAYVIPDDISSIEELDQWMEGFSFATEDQRRISNEVSMTIYGKTNYERYDELKRKFLGIEGDILKEDAPDAMMGNPILHADSYDDWGNAIIRARNAESIGLTIMVDTDEPIKELKDYDVSTIDKLQLKWNKLQSVDDNNRVLSNQTAQSIFGIDNDNLFISIKNMVINKLQSMASLDNENRDQIEYRKTLNIESSDVFATEVRKKLDGVDIIKKEDKIMPFFTPEEMNQFGVFSGEINLYSPKADNDLMGIRTVVEWFEEYSLMNGTVNPDPYEWTQTLKRLYLDYDKILESGDEYKIAARKQSILELGWNPEIRFDEDIAKRTYLRHQGIQEFSYIDLSRFYHHYTDDPLLESEMEDPDDDTIKPIFIVLFDVNLLRSKVIKAYTRSRFSHAALSMYPSMTKFYSYCVQPDKKDPTKESNGFNIETFNKYLNLDPNMKFAVNAIFVTGKQWKAIRNALDWYVYNKNKTEYNLGNILRIVTRQRQTEDTNTKMICSQFVYTILKIIDVKMKKDKAANLVTPQDLYKLKDPRIYKVYDGKMATYNGNKIKKMCNDMIQKYRGGHPGDLREAMVDGCDIRTLKGIVEEDTTLYNLLTPQSILVERVKGVEVDDKGTIVIKTVEDVNTEFFKCHRNLISYEKAGNYQGMKDELCKLKYLDNFAVRHMKNKNSKHYKEYADAHARITNDFNKYLKIVTDHEPDFNFSEYYKNSEWYDGEVRISKNLLDRIIEILLKILGK